MNEIYYFIISFLQQKKIDKDRNAILLENFMKIRTINSKIASLIQQDRFNTYSFRCG